MVGLHAFEIPLHFISSYQQLLQMDEKRIYIYGDVNKENDQLLILDVNRLLDLHEDESNLGEAIVAYLPCNDRLEWPLKKDQLKAGVATRYTIESQEDDENNTATLFGDVMYLKVTSTTIFAGREHKQFVFTFDP